MDSTRTETINEDSKVGEATAVEILSLVDNSVDFLSTIGHKQGQRRNKRGMLCTVQFIVLGFE